MMGTTKWPPSSVDAGKLIRKETSPDPNWPVCYVEVIRYFDTIKRAREMLKRLVDEGLTSYETERELGRGKRKKRPPIIYTDDDEDSDVPKYNKKKQSLSDDSDSDLVQHKKIRKFGKSKKIDQDIPAPPSLSFQHKTPSNISPDQNDRNRKIIVTVAHKNTGTASSLIEKIKSRKTERQVFQNLKEENLENALKKQKSTLTVPQLNVCAKSPLQQMNVTLSENNVNSMGDEKENMINESEVESSLGIPFERQSPSSRDTEVVRPSCYTPLRSPLLHRMSPRNSEIFRHQQYNCHRKMSQDDNDAESLSFDINKSIREIKSLCKTTLVRVEELSSKVDVTIMNQTRLNRSLLPAEKRIIRPSDLPALPVYTEDDLKAMERFLEDESNLSAMVHYLASFSLNKIEGKAAAQVMAKLISNVLACSYNFKGTDGSGKKGFQNLHLWEVVQGVIQMRFPESDLSDAKDSVMSWLRNAPWRKQEKGSNTGKRKSKSFLKESS
ncbi:uncharacterized protein LOC105255525 isoform X2 [Camponotus floridanus]|nr:uncharacterized protein LOC105255525 isoform X2 [Camponotus floridanus]